MSQQDPAGPLLKAPRIHMVSRLANRHRSVSTRHNRRQVASTLPPGG